MIRRALIAAAAACLAAAAQADDAKTLEDCVAGNAYLPHECSGMVAEPCVAASDQTTLAIVDCAMRETEAWDALLDRWYKALRADLDPQAADMLRDAQRAWIAFRDADCAFAYQQFIGGTLRTVAGAYCHRDRTATRAMELHGYLNHGS